MTAYIRDLRIPTTWLAALVVIAAIVAVMVGFNWNDGTSQPDTSSADRGQQSQAMKVESAKRARSPAGKSF